MNRSVEPRPSGPEVEHWTEAIADRADCAHCGATRCGHFCPQCGQKQLFDRLKFQSLVKDLLFRLTAFESGLLHTWWNLCRRPGQVARDYVSGKQRPYVNPLTYFFLCATLQLLAFWNVDGVFRAQLRDQFAAQLSMTRDQESLRRAGELLGEPVPDAMVSSYLSAVTQGYSYAALFFFAIPFGFMLWLLHRAAGEPFRFGETIVFSLFTFSQMLFYTAACTPITARIHTTLHLVMAIAVYLIIPQIAHGQFFQRTWLSRLMTFLSTIIAWVPFIASITALFVTSFLLKMLWAARAAAG